MSLSLTRMRYLVRKELGGLDSTDLPDTDVDEQLNISLWALEDSFPFEAKENLYYTTLVVDQYEYDMTSIIRLDSLRSLSVIDSDGERHKLARMSRDWLDANFSDDEKGLPTRYLRENLKLTLYPIPDEALTIEATIKQSVASLASGTVEETGLPRNWDEIVVAGAVWREHKARGDYNLAQQAANFQIGLIRQAVPTVAKEETDSRYARVEVIWEHPEDELQGYEQ